MTPPYANAPDVNADSYVILGLATCFLKGDGEVSEVDIVEPIPSAALEAILKGIPTSYKVACATTLGELLPGETAKLPAEFSETVQLCDDFVERTIATARTYQKRPEACQHIAVGTAYKDLNYSLERKRVLNSERIVSTEDNIKQHKYTHEVL